MTLPRSLVYTLAASVAFGVWVRSVSAGAFLFFAVGTVVSLRHEWREWPSMPTRWE